MKQRRWKPSVEQYTLVAISISLGAAALATRIPFMEFGSFRHMAGILVLSDLVLYLAIKLGFVKALRSG